MTHETPLLIIDLGRLPAERSQLLADRWEWLASKSPDELLAISDIGALAQLMLDHGMADAISTAGAELSTIEGELSTGDRKRD
jgi:hypothetical protein